MEWKANSRRCLAPPFCLGSQGFLNRAGMELELELLTKTADQLPGAEPGLGSFQFLKILLHLRSELVRAFGPSLASEQSFQSLLVELSLGLVKRRTRESKLIGRSSHGIGVGLECAPAVGVGTM